MENKVPAIPDAHEPILGVRVWNVHEGHLLSTVIPYVWVPGEAVNAECWHPSSPLQPFYRTSQSKGIGTPYHCNNLIHSVRRKGVIPPHEEGMCGVYGYKLNHVSAAFGHVSHYFARAKEAGPLRNATLPCIGLVFMWGKTVVGEFGYKSQFAYPAFCLILQCESITELAEETAFILSNRYSIKADVHVLDDLALENLKAELYTAGNTIMENYRNHIKAENRRKGEKLWRLLGL